MARFKILFADDQIPEESLTEENIKAEVKRKYPKSEYLWNAFSIMGQAVATLRAAGYDVTVARTAKDAISLAKKRLFDLAIIDMGWYADNNISDKDAPYYGWQICDAIDQTDRELKRQPTPQIMYSNRFQEEAGMSADAAEKGKLPIYKIYSEAGHQALKAAVKFIEHLVSRPSEPERIERDFIIQLKNQALESLRMSLKQQMQWFKLTILFVALSIGLLLFGALGAVLGNVQVGTLTSISSILSGLISSLLYRQLQKSEEAVKKSQEKVLQLYAEAKKAREHEKKDKP